MTVKIHKKYVLFAITGAVSGSLLQPLLRGSLDLPPVLYAILPSLIFSLLMTISALFLSHDSALRTGLMKRYILGSVVLAAGMPVAFVSGAGSLNLVDLVLPGDRFHLGSIGYSFFFAELTSCLVWSFAIYFWTLLVNKAKASQVLRASLLVTIAIMLLCSLVELVSTMLWQRSYIFPMISMGEEIASALLLAFGSGGYYRQAVINSTEPSHGFARDVT